MIIQLANRKISDIMSLDNGDVFKFGDCYFIAGEINMPDNCRECFNLTSGYVCKLRHNPVVEYWHGDDAILKLCDEVE